MLTHQQARHIAEKEVNDIIVGSGIDDLTIVDNETLEKSYAWIFFYSSRRYIETGDINYAIGGNGPLFISKIDGHISTFPTGLSINGMVDEYEETHKIWKLIISDTLYTDLKQTLALKIALRLSTTEIAEYKHTHRTTLDIGSESRLSRLQKELSDKNISTQLLPIDAA